MNAWHANVIMSREGGAVIINANSGYVRNVQEKRDSGPGAARDVVADLKSTFSDYLHLVKKSSIEF